MRPNNFEALESPQQQPVENSNRLQEESLRLRSDRGLAPKPSAAGTLAKEIEFDVRMMNDPSQKEMWSSVKKSIDGFRDDKGEKLESQIFSEFGKPSIVFTDKKGNQGMVAELTRGIAAVDDGKNLDVLDTAMFDLSFRTGQSAKDIRIPRGQEVASTLLEMSTALGHIGDDQAISLKAGESSKVGRSVDSAVERIERLYNASITSFELSMKASGVPVDNARVLNQLDNAANELDFPAGQTARATFMEKALAKSLESKSPDSEQITKRREQLADSYLSTNDFEKARGHLQKLNDGYAKDHPGPQFDERRVQLVAQLALAEARTNHLPAAESLLSSLSGQDLGGERRLVSSTHRYLANQYANSDQADRSEEHFNKAVAVSPKHGLERPLALGGLAGLHEKTGKREDAKAAYDKFNSGMQELAEDVGSSSVQRSLAANSKEVDRLFDSYSSFLSSDSGSEASISRITKLRTQLKQDQ